MKAHICIGGPLDGEFATSEDFYGHWDRQSLMHERGMYEHLKNEYAQFHNASRSRKRAQVCWIHVPLLPVSISPRKR